MGRVPERLRLDAHYAFYLSPRGCAGTDAIAYLPASNDPLRQRYIRKGFKLLSECRGDFSEKGGPDALVIAPPTDETIRTTAATLESRLDDELVRLEGEIETATEKMEDADGKERGVYRAKLRSLERARRELPDEVPSFEELKWLFVTVHQRQIYLGIPAELREGVVKLEEAQRWMGVANELKTLVTRQEAERPQPKATASRRKAVAEATA